MHAVLNKLNSLRIFRRCFYFTLVFCGVWQIAYTNEPTAEPAHTFYRIDIDSTINPGAVSILKHGIKTAEQANANALIIRLNTPGGLLSSTRDMVTLISESKIPIITYVAPNGANAGSAGAFILLASHIAVMNEGTNVGASSPISNSGDNIKGTLGKKVMNDTKAFMRSIAQSRNRNIEVAELFVSEAKSLTAKEALSDNVIDLLAQNENDLIKQLTDHSFLFNGQTHSFNLNNGNAQWDIIDIDARLVDRLLVHLAHPQIAHLLISLGTLGIYIEIIGPGLAFPGIFGAIAVILGLVCVQTLPVNIGFLMLLFLGIALMVSEYFVAGFGVLGIGGACAFIIGSLYLYDAPMPADTQSGILSASIAIGATMVLMTFLMSYSLFNSPRKKRMTGKTGEAMMDFDKDGYVLIDGKRWQARTSCFLHHGDQVTVVEHDELDILAVNKTSDTCP